MLKLLRQARSSDKLISHILPGLRTLKTGLCVLICLLVGWFTGYHWPVMACVAAIIALQDSPHKSIEIGVARIIGTLIGGAIGIGCLYLLMHSPHDALVAPICAVGAILAVMITVFINRKSACSIAAITVLAVALIAPDDPDATYIHAYIRVAETLAGVMLAIVVNKLLWFKKDGDEEKDPADDEHYECGDEGEKISVRPKGKKRSKRRGRKKK